MAPREIIVIDEEKCDGCGACAKGCPEGAIQLLEGKARLVGEVLCDGLGACVGECPRGAIRIEKREAEAYDEARVMEGMARLGPAVLAAHLDHLLLPDPRKTPAGKAEASPGEAQCPLPSSTLGHWPIQLRLINPRAAQYSGARLLVAADCTAFALGGFHSELLEGRSLVIACPKLDDRTSYMEKLQALLGLASSAEVAIMEVPCCSGLLKLVVEAREGLGSSLPIDVVVIGVGGGIARRKRV